MWSVTAPVPRRPSSVLLRRRRQRLGRRSDRAARRRQRFRSDELGDRRSRARMNRGRIQRCWRCCVVARPVLAQDTRLSAKLDKPTLTAVNAIVDSARVAKLPTRAADRQSARGRGKGLGWSKNHRRRPSALGSDGLGEAARSASSATADEIKAAASAPRSRRVRARPGAAARRVGKAAGHDAARRAHRPDRAEGADPHGDESRAAVRAIRRQGRRSRALSAERARRHRSRRRSDGGRNHPGARPGRPRPADRQARQSSVPTDVSGTIPGLFGFGEFMRRVALLGAAAVRSPRRCRRSRSIHTPFRPRASTLWKASSARSRSRAPSAPNFTETSHYDDVVAFIDSLKTLGAKISTGSIGKTSEGRELPYVIASRPLVTTPAEARRLQSARSRTSRRTSTRAKSKGKEAMQALLRDLAVRQKEKRPRLDRADRPADLQRRRQREVGRAGAESRRAEWPGAWSARDRTRRGWNLNRDYIGADAPETRGVARDVEQVESRSVHGSPHHRRQHPRLRAHLLAVAHAHRGERSSVHANTMLPVIRQRMRERHGFEVHDYGDFSRPAPRVAAVAVRRAARQALRREALAGRGADSRGRGAAPRGGGGGGGRGGPSLEQMIADSIPQRLGVLDLRIVRALRHELLRPAQSHRDSERGVLARSIRPPRRLDVRLRHARFCRTSPSTRPRS